MLSYREPQLPRAFSLHNFCTNGNKANVSEPTATLLIVASTVANPNKKVKEGD